MTNKIRKALDVRLASNHFETVITMKKTGKEFDITQLLNKKILVYTDKGYNEEGEVIWNTKVGVFKDTYAVAKFIESQI